MTWPTGPPPMPVAGWYEDPEQEVTWRYWDGAAWTHHRSPMWVPPVRDPRSLSVWFERGLAAVKVVVRRVGLLLAATWLLVGAAGCVLFAASFNSGRGRELRRLLDFDSIFGAFGTTSTTTLTDAEADRAWELTQDLFWSALPWMILLVVVSVLLSAWSVAVVALAVRSHADGAADPDPAALRLDGVVDIAGAAVRRAPAVFGSGIVVLAIFAGVLALAWLPVVALAVVEAGGAAIVLTVLFVVLLTFVLMAWLWGRLALAPVIAGVGGHGVGVRRSWDLTDGQFWFVFGRLLLTGLIAGVTSTVLNSFTGLLQFVSFSIYVSVWLVMQAVGVAVSVVVTVCGHLAAIDQAERSESDERLAHTGSSSGHRPA